MNHLLEALAIFSAINSVWRGANNGHTSRLKCTGQFKGCLATELNDYTFGLFNAHDFQHIFQSDRFKEQSIGGVVICGYSLWVTVDHNGFIAIFAHCQGSVNTAVIKLNTLTNTVGAAAENKNLVAVAWACLALFFISGVHVGGICRKLCCAGVNALINGVQTQLVTQFAHGGFATA